MSGCHSSVIKSFDFTRAIAVFLNQSKFHVFMLDSRDSGASLRDVNVCGVVVKETSTSSLGKYNICDTVLCDNSVEQVLFF